MKKRKFTQAESRHNKLLEEIVRELHATGDYGKIRTYVEYNIDGINGEVDILADYLPDNTYHFYEVKCTLNDKSIAKAQRQYNRYKSVHPNKRLEGRVVAYNGSSVLK